MKKTIALPKSNMTYLINYLWLSRQHIRVELKTVLIENNNKKYVDKYMNERTNEWKND